jgi:hypothetical protein
MCVYHIPLLEFGISSLAVLARGVCLPRTQKGYFVNNCHDLITLYKHHHYQGILYAVE